MSFNIDVARAMVRGYNIVQAEITFGDTVPPTIAPPADDDDAFIEWFDSGANDGPLVTMDVTPLRQSYSHPDMQQPGSWSPERAIHLMMRGLGFNVTEDQTEAIVGGIHECWQGYTWMSYGAEKLAECFPVIKSAATNLKQGVDNS